MKTVFTVLAFVLKVALLTAVCAGKVMLVVVRAGLRARANTTNDGRAYGLKGYSFVRVDSFTGEERP